jgi:hypothetical protein
VVCRSGSSEIESRFLGGQPGYPLGDRCGGISSQASSSQFQEIL